MIHSDTIHGVWDSGPVIGTQMVLFRRKAAIDTIPEHWPVRLTADSRYRLYVNGQRVGDGPCRPSPGRRYVDEWDIAPFLRPGNNVMVAWVAHYPPDEASNQDFCGGPVAVLTDAIPFFALDDQQGIWNTDARWQCRRASGYHFTHIVSQLSFMETVDHTDFPATMYTADDAGEWVTALPLTIPADRFQPVPRPIPVPFEEEDAFQRLVRCGGDNVDWNALPRGESLCIPPHTDGWVELAANRHLTALPVLQFDGGRGSRITITYAESYKQARPDGTLYKACRDDAGERAVLDGFADCVIADGTEQRWMPFWYRAFRFVRLHIRTADAPLTLKTFRFLRTGYPLTLSAAFRCDREDYNDIWQISLNTLQNCMYETYMDCPYYEQLQYVMDTVLQMQFAGRITHDDRLTRRAMADFFGAQLPSGLIPANSPAKLTQIIPGFALFAVYMLELYQRRYDNSRPVVEYLPAVDKILGFFEKALNEEGLVSLPDHWSFVDWVSGWQGGTPLTAPGNGNVIYTMMFAAALRSASRLYRLTGDDSTAVRLWEQADALCDTLCAFRDGDGLFWDERPGPGKSQHAQLWAVLSETVTGEEAAALMRQTWTDESLSPVSYCMVWLLLRAMEKAGLYEQTESIWEKYRCLLPLNITTLPEDDLDARSDCHAWSAVALYEFTAHGLGIRESADGEQVLIHPQMWWLDWCEGAAPTKFGTVAVRWEKKRGKLLLTVRSETETPLHIQLPNGESHTLIAQSATYTIRL